MEHLKTIILLSSLFTFGIFINFCLYPLPKLFSAMTTFCATSKIEYPRLAGRQMNGNEIECGKSSYQPPAPAFLSRIRRNEMKNHTKDVKVKVKAYRKTKYSIFVIHIHFYDMCCMSSLLCHAMILLCEVIRHHFRYTIPKLWFTDRNCKM